jgi:hypothetical protein
MWLLLHALYGVFDGLFFQGNLALGASCLGKGAALCPCLATNGLHRLFLQRAIL